MAQNSPFPPSVIPPPAPRLTSHITRNSIHQDMILAGTRDAQINVDLNNIYDHYSPLIIERYDLISLGYLQSAQLLAQQIPAGFQPTSILDLGTGTGNTLIEVCKAATVRAPLRHIAFLDLIPPMALRARQKLDEQMVYHRSITLLTHPHQVIMSIRSHSDLQGIRMMLSGRPAPDLITAQRVLLNVTKAHQAQCLGDWMSLASPEGKLMVDVSHPDRHVGLEWIGQPGIPGTHLCPVQQHCFQIADDIVWEECRAYARELAAAAGLQIEVAMMAQRPTHGIVDKRPAIQQWITQRRPTGLTDPLSQAELQWFLRDYLTTVKPLYNNMGYSHQYEHAAVIVVFSRQSSAATASTPSAVQKPSRQERRRAEQDAKKDAKKYGGHGGGAGGAGVVC